MILAALKHHVLVQRLGYLTAIQRIWSCLYVIAKLKWDKLMVNQLLKRNL